MKPLHFAAVLATFLLVVTGVNSLMRPPPRPDVAKKKKPPSTKVGDARCTIRRAVFGGTETALLRVMKGRIVHYVVLDLPGNNPMTSKHQSGWLDANYGQAQPTVVGVYPTVQAAVTKAADLCRRN